MIAYNRLYLDNRAVQSEASEALAKKIITAEEHQHIRASYPYHFYTPNIYIRIGLFLLTVVILLCCLGLFMLGGVSSENGIGILLIFFGIVSYAALEFFIYDRKVYRSGIDDALLWIASGLVFGGINLCASHINASMESLIIFLLATAGVLRYADHVIALVAYGACLSMIFHIAIGLGPAARAFLPFLIMVVAVVLYLLFTRLSAEQYLRNYHSCLALLQMAALLSFYLAGNYYIVRELNAYISGSPRPVALSWLWWLLTAIVPIIYLIRGIQKKDVIFLWAGLALIAASIFTVRYYYHVLPAELAMIIGGSVLIGGAYGLIRYLHSPKYGLTSIASGDPHLLEKLHIEALVLAETFQSAASRPADTGVRFGGGSGGGGGATGEF
jgi:hypothetical protein